MAILAASIGAAQQAFGPRRERGGRQHCGAISRSTPRDFRNPAQSHPLVLREQNTKENMMSRLALLSAAVSLSLLATPVLAQTFSAPNGNDTVATREQGNTATVGHVGQPHYNGWNRGGG